MLGSVAGSDGLSIRPSRVTIAAIAVVSIISAALLSERRDLPQLHTALDTASLVLCGVLAMYFWDIGRRTDSPLSAFLATAFGLSAATEAIHVLMVVEWSAQAETLTLMRERWRPATWPLAAHVLPVGIIAAVLLAPRRPISQGLFAVMLATAGIALGVLFATVPRYVPHSVFGVSRPWLLAAPFLWGAAAWLSWRARAMNRTLPSLTYMCAVVALGLVAMLYSLSPNDSQGMVAHLAKVVGYLGLLLYQAQASSDDLVGRVKAEGELQLLNRDLESRVRAQSAQFRSSMEESPVGMILVNDQGRMILVNREVERLFGYSREELLHKPVEMLVPTHLLPQHTENRQSYFAAPTARRMGAGRDLFGRHKNGADVPVEIALNPIEGGEGRLVMASIVDIAERKRIDMELRDSEKYYRAILENISDAVIITSAEGMIIDVNPMVTKLTGWSRDELLKMHARETYPPQQAHEQIKRQANATVGHVQYERTMMRKDGSEFIAEISAQMMPDGRYLGSIRDVTDRRKKTDELAESESRFRQIAENIREAFFLLDLVDDKTIYVSPVWGDIWGRPVSVAYAHAMAWMDHVHEEDRPRLLAFSEMIVRGLPTNDTFRVLRPDGSTRWVRGRAFPIRREDGRVYRLAGVVEDITDLRRVEEQMTQAQKMEAVGRLAGGVAHDFNNLLTVILSEADLARAAKGVPADVSEGLASISDAGERAAVLTRQLLMFSRRQLVTPEVFDLNDLVTSIEKLLRRLIGEDVTVKTTFAGRACRVRADRGQLEQVLMNLAVNARDAMPAGGTLSIETSVKSFDAETERGLPAGTYVLMAVSDTGIGMTPSVRDHIFEPFFTTKEAGKGTGLGLATSYGIIKQAGGEIAVYSELGVGTTMKVYLPSVKAQDTPVATPVVTATPMGAETVLLVEDEAALRRVGARILTGLGYGVLEAKDGEDAVKVASNHAGRIDLLLTDVVLPGIGGREVAERIAALRSGIKVLFMSGYTDDIILRHKLVERDVVMVEKPFTRDSLARIVRKVLDT
jgi:two-component system cell cycle sensor histidine kinase/response regulator CckA